jgi:hypothetical protein
MCPRVRLTKNLVNTSQWYGEERHADFDCEVGSP